MKLAGEEQDIQFTDRIHVWVYGRNAEEVERLTEYLGGISLFVKKPEDNIELR